MEALALHGPSPMRLGNSPCICSTQHRASTLQTLMKKVYMTGIMTMQNQSTMRYHVSIEKKEKKRKDYAVKRG